ncbi:MAG: deoxyuridine 5'-triphosphate nucleotidohydrolase, partial [Clostridia bacterium]|nr:deoxyuridine 5'-triphosphate nucleotidohydrolase [Clostridia bacterium]
MVRIAKFEKVSLKQFVSDWVSTFPQQSVEQAILAYEHIQLPKRATSGSAGYDFFAPVGFELPAGGNIKMPTGIRALIEDGWVLTIYPRSGLG